MRLSKNVNPNGKIDKKIRLPVRKPTSLCFGGKKLDTLFITSAQDFTKSNSKIKKNKACRKQYSYSEKTLPK